jgi:hypothetical protein
VKFLALLFLACACNPAPRCTAVEDCPMGAWCSGGFCSDGPAPPPREMPVDQDGPDAGIYMPEPVHDAGIVTTNGRDSGL